MIPDLDDNGYLPPGIHVATLDGIESRFGQSSENRRAEIEALSWLVELARRAGALRLIINGSFVSDADEPGDVDCVLLIDDDYPRDSDADNALQVGLPFLHIEFAQKPDFDWFVEKWFATDRHEVPKGMLEVLL